MYSFVKTNICPDCGVKFRTLRTAHGNQRYCWVCRKKRLRLIHSSGYLTPRPELSPASPARRTRRRPMSRTKKGAKGPGYEYWSRRPAKGCVDPGKRNKTVTHRLERAAAKRELDKMK